MNNQFQRMQQLRAQEPISSSHHKRKKKKRIAHLESLRIVIRLMRM